MGLARAVLFALVLVTLPASAQNFPSKPVRIIVPFSPGSILDTIARFVSTRTSEAWGQPVVVENRAGAGGRLGSEQVMKSPPDGHTLLLGSAGTHVGAVFLSKDLAYDPVKDFTPITLAVEPISCLVAHASLPVSSLAELVEYAKRNPGKLAYASNGVGSVFHFAGEIFKQTAGVDILHVPLKGAGDVMNAVVGGHVLVAFASASAVPPYVSGGKIRVLGMNVPARYARLPGVPTMTEQVAGYEPPGSWLGFFGPAKMPPALLARINGDMVKALNAPDVKPKLEDNGMLVVANTPEQFAEAIRQGLQVYGRAAKLAGIKPE
jgi:tripartite-type tricarboxylate transporter receptor subunit TctC